jgi:hypothetical protein
MSPDFVFNPEIRLVGGMVIRNRQDAIDFLRAHEARPGIDDRDEILHRLERAGSAAESERAAQLFRKWLGALEVVDERL